MDTFFYGVVAVLASGVLQGGFTLPMKLVKVWQWENVWFLFGLFGLLILPTLTAFLTVPRLLEVYQSAPPSAIGLALGLGLGWGFGSLFFGLGISALGLSLGYAIILGTTAVFGTLIPALALSPEIFGTPRGSKLLASLALIVLGLSLCAIAGSKRDTAGSDAPRFRILIRTHFKKGLLICLLSGVLSACFNIGFALTAEISKTAERLGASPTDATFAIWALILGAGFLPSAGYTFYLMKKNRSFKLFRTKHINWSYAFLMGVLWVVAVKLYGTGAVHIGESGATIGWPIVMGATIISANLFGILFAEWRGLDRTTMAFLYSGLAILLAAVLLAGSAGV